MQANTVGKLLSHMEAEALVDTFPDTLSEMVAKTIADTLTCVEAEAPVKTGDTIAGVDPYTDLDIINEFEAMALVYTQAYTFS